MKKITINLIYLLTIASLLFYNMVYYFVFMQMVKYAKDEIKIQIANNHYQSYVEKFAYYNENISWIEKNVEFTLNNKLYDVVYIEKGKDGNLYIYAINDKNEEYIRDFYKKHIELNKKLIYQIILFFSNNHITLIQNYVTPYYYTFINNYVNVFLKEIYSPPKEILNL
jgi:hypothetical protein